VRPSLLWPALATLITAIALMCFVSTAHGATFSNTVDTDIYLYYGHGSVTDQQNAPGVWDDGGLNYYKGVWHLSNNIFDDSTSNADNGANTNTSDMGGTKGALDCECFSTEALHKR